VTLLPAGKRWSAAGLKRAGAASGVLAAGVVLVPPVMTVIEVCMNVFALDALSSTLVVLFGKPANVEMGKLTLVAPWGTVTVAGTVADPGTRLLSETTTPPAGAGLGTVTVPVAVVPAFTVPGLTV
jgi:hypothetical protein